MKKVTTLTAIASVLLGFPLLARAWDVPYAEQAPQIDGDDQDPAWTLGEWRALDKPIFDTNPGPEDFAGRYKLVWTAEHLYLLADITDDILIDTHADPTAFYWDDDALEIFIDEDASGGQHQFTHNAFAYHVALDNQSIDLGAFRNAAERAAGTPRPERFDHVHARWQRQAGSPPRLLWEARITLYREQATPGESDSSPALERVYPQANKVLGFMLAYCDADSADGREHFYGDVAIEPVNGDRNRGYIDASVFGRIRLAPPPP